MEIVKIVNETDEVAEDSGVDEEYLEKIREKHKVLRSIVATTVGIGVGKVVDTAIDAIVPTPAKLPAKLLFKLGSFAISCFAGDWAGDKALKYADVVFVVVDKVKEGFEETENEDSEEVDNDGNN